RGESGHQCLGLLPVDDASDGIGPELGNDLAALVGEDECGIGAEQFRCSAFHFNSGDAGDGSVLEDDLEWCHRISPRVRDGTFHPVKFGAQKIAGPFRRANWVPPSAKVLPGTPIAKRPKRSWRAPETSAKPINGQDHPTSVGRASS